MAPTATTWPASTITSIRRATAGTPCIQREDHTEWNWECGAVWLATPARAVQCVACDGPIAKGELSYYVVHIETGPGVGRTASKRYLHRHDCLQEAATSSDGLDLGEESRNEAALSSGSDLLALPKKGLL